MNRLIKKDRLIALAAVFVLLLAVYIVALYDLQIVQGQEYYEESKNYTVTTSTVTAVRGNVLDRYGRVLVQNKTCYNLTINTSELFADGVDSNATILRLVEMVREYGDDYIDDLPITTEPPFEYTELSTIDEAKLQAYKKQNGLDENASAVEVMSSMRDRYDIDSNYTAQEARIIAAVRYAVNVRYLIATADYVFVEDADLDLITTIKENSILGVNIKESFVRRYNTEYAAHILGYIGLMNDEEYEKYSELGYAGDAKVGKDGVEYAFEKYLHGTDGEVTVTSAADGTVISTEYTVEPQPGNNVYLSIDIALQETAERALASHIATLQAKNDAKAIEDGEKTQEQIDEERASDTIHGDEINGGAVAVVDVKTGEPLALASWPTYNISTLIEDYSDLLKERYDPLFNRALQGTYAPGSTFKPCTAIAALTEGKISTGTAIVCEGLYTELSYAGFTPKCWVYPGKHGAETIIEAIRDSCNCFFYTAGYNTGIDNLEKYARLLGLGESTGIEVYESTGNMSNRRNHAYYAGQEWLGGDTVQASIGQADSMFTPLQLAEYCAAVASNGERHSASILKEVRSYDFSKKIYERETEVLSKVESEQYNWDAIHEGMSLVASDPSGSGYSTFGSYTASTVACKTGTAQKGEGITNDGIFICYAPVEDPQIAIAVVIQRAGAGANCAPVAREILEAYFSMQTATDMTETEGEFLK